MSLGLLRGLACAIAVAAIIDPAVSLTRRTRPEIALIAADSMHHELARAVASQLHDRFTVLRAPFAAAAATVLVGDDLPGAAELAAPLFAVLPEPAVPSVRITAVSAPARAQLHARVPVLVTLDLRGASGRRLDLTLRMNGVVVDRVQRTLQSESRVDLPLRMVGTAAGAVPLRVTAELAGANRAETDVMIEIDDQRWAVLFYDPRPSWPSTFVRRAIERDPRFDVSSRIVTSRNLSSDAGQPPQSLAAPGSAASWDAIVVGAPESLSVPEVEGLEAFVRRRGGTVILLLDQNREGPHQSLMRVAGWSTRNALTPVQLQGAASEELRASTVIAPTQLPPGARSLAHDTVNRPVIWRTALGNGQLIVSGAIDAWKFRDPASSDFDRFWQTLVAQAAAAAAPPIAVHIAEPQLEAGQRTDLIVSIRDAANSEPPAAAVRASANAAIELPDGAHGIRLWPEAVGRFRGELRAPGVAGTYRVQVSTDAGRETAFFTVVPAARRPDPDHTEVVDALVSSRGGSIVSEQDLEQLPDRIARALETAPRQERWHPMRSAWWIVPFVLVLGLEWWLRRRRGLA